jgi:hypothetical protein
MQIKSEELNELINVESEKINQISLIAEENKAIIKDSLKYTVIPYMPISKQFINKYILNNIEYPLLESKLSQSAIEMKSRLNNLVDTEYQFQKTGIEIQTLEVEKEEIAMNTALSEKRKKVEIAEKDLEIKIRKYRLTSYKSSMDSCFAEFKNWSETVKGCIEAIKEASVEANRKDPSVPIITEFTDINFDMIRTAEMAIKVQRWQALEQMGAELTPSQKIFTENDKFEKIGNLFNDKLISYEKQKQTEKLQFEKEQQELESLKSIQVKL